MIAGYYYVMIIEIEKCEKEFWITGTKRLEWHAPTDRFIFHMVTMAASLRSTTMVHMNT